jgi:hypothetical protein
VSRICGIFDLIIITCPLKECVSVVDLQIALHLSQSQEGREVPMMKIVVDSLGTNVQMRTFDLMVNAYLGSVYIQHLQFKGNPTSQGLEFESRDLKYFVFKIFAICKFTALLRYQKFYT